MARQGFFRTFLMVFLAVPLAMSGIVANNATEELAFPAPNFPHDTGDGSMRTCEQLTKLRDSALELFERPLTKQEYYKRNFMWMRCRSRMTSFFDVGGSWPGDWGKDLRNEVKHLDIMNWRFKYANGKWGDAVVFFHLFTEQPLTDTVAVIQHLGQSVAAKYGRNFYVIDCPGFKNDAHYGTERSAVRFPNSKGVAPKGQLIAVYRDSRVQQ